MANNSICGVGISYGASIGGKGLDLPVETVSADTRSVSMFGDASTGVTAKQIFDWLGVRMLDGPITDGLEAEALMFNTDYIHIYSASWGPTDDGKTLEGPGDLTKAALKQAAEEVFSSLCRNKQIPQKASLFISSTMVSQTAE